MAESEVGDLDRRRHPAEHHHLVGPVELVGFTRREPQRDEDRALLRSGATPGARVTLHAVVGALVSLGTQQLE